MRGTCPIPDRSNIELSASVLSHLPPTFVFFVLLIYPRTTHHSTNMTIDPTTLTHTPEHSASPVVDLWFPDGNLILKAEKSLFRIYSGLLAARSSVFKDMLAFPPPAEGNEMFEGCPIVTVYDSSKDINFFLKAVFDSRCVSLVFSQENTFDLSDSLASLSHLQHRLNYPSLKACYALA